MYVSLKIYFFKKLAHFFKKNSWFKIRIGKILEFNCWKSRKKEVKPQLPGKTKSTTKGYKMDLFLKKAT